MPHPLSLGRRRRPCRYSSPRATNPTASCDTEAPPDIMSTMLLQLH
uniref:Uncharacterized protein n=1 Tax=Arundo donax TaxID=35708 RepID=A0A0A9H0Z1_ARUDO